MDRITETSKNITLATTSLRPVNIYLHVHAGVFYKVIHSLTHFLVCAKSYVRSTEGDAQWS